MAANKLPAKIDPMLARLGKLPARQSEYLFEFKWDGIRAILFIEQGRIRIMSRNMKNLTVAFPDIAVAGGEISEDGLVLDGEIVAMNEAGIPDFGAIQPRIHISSAAEALKRSEAIPTTLFVFDVLFHKYNSLMNMPLIERRKILEAIALPSENWRVSAAYEGEGDALYQTAQEAQLEGIVAKLKHSRYEPGCRTGTWIKIKLVQSNDFVIGGWTDESTGRRDALGALLLGYYESNGVLKYAGKVGTGFTERSRGELTKQLWSVASSEKPFRGVLPKEKCHFTIPKLVAEIEHRGWTRDGKIRQGAFKGLRTDINALDVVKPELGE